jgi:hypothetical protein
MEFQAWPKTPRLFRDIVVTEKIDGTNAAVIVKRLDEDEAQYSWAHVTTDEDGQSWGVAAQSRKRLIFPGNDNFGFAKWVYENAYALRTHLGEGYHYGEWWGNGIQRGYEQAERHFSLFNTHRFANIEEESAGLLKVVPTLYEGPFSEEEIRTCIDSLEISGSRAVPGYYKPEGVCVYHTQSKQVYKVLIENDHLPKGAFQ